MVYVSGSTVERDERKEDKKEEKKASRKLRRKLAGKTWELHEFPSILRKFPV